MTSCKKMDWVTKLRVERLLWDLSKYKDLAIDPEQIMEQVKASQALFKKTMRQTTRHEIKPYYHLIIKLLGKLFLRAQMWSSPIRFRVLNERRIYKRMKRYYKDDECKKK